MAARKRRPSRSRTQTVADVLEPCLTVSVSERNAFMLEGATDLLSTMLRHVATRFDETDLAQKPPLGFWLDYQSLAGPSLRADCPHSFAAMLGKLIFEAQQLALFQDEADVSDVLRDWYDCFDPDVDHQSRSRLASRLKLAELPETGSPQFYAVMADYLSG